MSRARAVLFWCHLATGVAVALVVLVMSATGVLLTYQRQLTAWADARALRASAPAAGPRLPLDALLRRVEAAAGARATAVTLRADPAAPVEVAFGRERTLFVDAASGATLGEGSPAARRLFRGVTTLHRWLGAAGERRPVGKAVTGAANLGFLFLVLSGAVLWWPRNRTRAAFRSVALLRRGLSGKARDFNWHHVVGLWLWAPLVVVVASGVVMSYGWANALVYRAVGEAPPPARPEGDAGGRAPARAPVPPPSSATIALDTVAARARQRMPAWRSLSITLPRPGAPVVASVDGGTGGQPQRRAQLTVDAASGAEAKWQPFEANTPGRRLRSVLRFAHTGELLGLAGQTLAGLASLGACVLVWTGLALSWRRLRAWRGRRSLARLRPHGGVERARVA